MNKTGLMRTMVLCSATLLALSIGAAGQTESVLYTFPNANSGENPNTGLVFDQSGNLYGATETGGNASTCTVPNGCGVVYKLSPNGTGGWTQTVLYNFAGAPDGAQPVGSLALDAAGNLYGATNLGGVTYLCPNTYDGCGVIYKLSPNSDGSWTETILYAFPGGTLGAFPAGGVILDSAGNLYGTTVYGGYPCLQEQCGVVFKLSPTSSGSWNESILHTFTGNNDGGNPVFNLVMDAAGNIYGATYEGGFRKTCCGVVFKLSAGPEGWKETVLHTFSEGAEGAYPSGLVLDAAGNVYGTASAGGSSTACLGGWCGVVFKLAASSTGFWKETPFQFGQWDGAQPATGLAIDAAGNLYGATVEGGPLTTCATTFGCGVVFKLAPNATGGWTPSVLYRFTGGSDGGNPHSGPIMDAFGNLYGTAQNDGANGLGVVYKITP